MKKAVFFVVTFVWLLLVYLAQTLAYILESISASDDKFSVISNMGEYVKFPLMHPFKNSINLINEGSTVFFILIGIGTVFAIYVLMKQLFGERDNNSNNQNYKIAKHGSHGSANFATDSELFSKNHYKKVKESDMKKVVLASIDINKVKGLNNNDNSTR